MTNFEQIIPPALTLHDHFAKIRGKIIDAKLASGGIIVPKIKNLTGVPYEITIKGSNGVTVVMAGTLPEVKRRFRKNKLPVKLGGSYSNGAIFTDLRNETKFVRVKKGWLKVIMI